MKRVRFQPVMVLLVILPALPVLAAPHGGGAVVSGIVRDAQGVPQMGALVQALMPDSSAAGMAVTDPKGHYLIRNLKPGKYLVRATAALFLPSSRGDLRLRAGAQTVVNLTLTTLFEESQWLPAERRKADEPRDEWTWTLRSPASRPILRMTDDDQPVLVVADADNAGEGQPVLTRTRIELSGSADTFGKGGMRHVLTHGRASADGTEMLLQANIGGLQGPYPYGSSSSASLSYQRPMGMAGFTRMRASFQNHPEMMAQGGTAGYRTYELDSAEVVNFGDTVRLEAGNSLRAVGMNGLTFDSRPFVRLTMHPNEAIVLSYRMARSRDVQGADDMDSAEAALPVGVQQNGQMLLEQGTHHEWSVGRKVGQGMLRAGYYRDSLERPMVSGAGELSSAQLAVGGVLVDRSTRTLRLMGNAYNSQGWTISFSGKVGGNVWTSIELDTGDTLVSRTRPGVETENLASTLSSRRAKSALVAVRGTMPKTATQVRGSYRWQELGTVTPVNYFGEFSRQPYLSFQVRQPMRIRRFRIEGMAAFLEVTNLLQEGYQPFLSSDGKTLLLAQAPRSVQAGLAFTF